MKEYAYYVYAQGVYGGKLYIGNFIFSLDDKEPTNNILYLHVLNDDLDGLAKGKYLLKRIGDL